MMETIKLSTPSPLSTAIIILICLLADQITVIGNKMSVKTSRFANVWSHIKQIVVIDIHLKLWNAVTRHIIK